MRNQNSYFSLPYNPKLRERARELRQARNLCEVVLWKELHKKKFKQYDFDRQKIIGNYIVDFYCGNCNVVIEIDGSSHDNKVDYDNERDTFLEGLGLTVIHISARDVLNNLDCVMEMLNNHPALCDGEVDPLRPALCDGDTEPPRHYVPPLPGGELGELKFILSEVAVCQ